MDDLTKDEIIYELTQTIKACKCDIKQLRLLLEKISDIGFEFLTLNLHTGGHVDDDVEDDEGFTGHS